MRILLVNPRFPESFWGLNRIGDLTGKRYVTPTLALPTLAALTPPGHEVALVDENVEEIDFDAPCDLVGISSMSVQGPKAFEIAARFRERGKAIAMGGSLPTLSPDLCRPHADAVFVGEAERTWPRFVREYESGRHGEIYEETDRIDMKTSPVPRFDLLRMDRYFIHAIQFSRGCPYDCEFCDIVVMLGRKPRTKSVSQLLAEVEEVYRLGGRRIFIVDDNFIGDRKKAKDVLRALREWNAERGYPMMFNTESSLNAADDDELLGLFHDARFVRLFIGIETPREASLRETRKYMNLKDSIISQVHKIQSYGIQVTAGMIVGFDHDDPSIFREQTRFLEEARIPQAMSGMLQAMPKTPLYDRLKREGRLNGESIGDNIRATNVIPKGMTEEELLRGYAGMLRGLYDYDNYARRVIAYLTSERIFEPIQPEKKTKEEVRILLRFLAFSLFGGDAARRRFARKILLEAARKYPRRLPEALYLAVVHKHFHEFVGEATIAIERTADEAAARRVAGGGAAERRAGIAG